MPEELLRECQSQAADILSRMQSHSAKLAAAIAGQEEGTTIADTGKLQADNKKVAAVFGALMKTYK